MPISSAVGTRIEIDFGENISCTGCLLIALGVNVVEVVVSFSDGAPAEESCAEGGASAECTFMLDGTGSFVVGGGGFMEDFSSAFGALLETVGLGVSGGGGAFLTDCDEMALTAGSSAAGWASAVSKRGLIAVSFFSVKLGALGAGRNGCLRISLRPAFGETTLGLAVCGTGSAMDGGAACACAFLDDMGDVAPLLIVKLDCAFCIAIDDSCDVELRLAITSALILFGVLTVGRMDDFVVFWSTERAELLLVSSSRGAADKIVRSDSNVCASSMVSREVR